MYAAVEEKRKQTLVNDRRRRVAIVAMGATINEQSQRRLTIRIIIVMTDDERSRMRETSKPIFGNTSLSHANATFGAKMQ